MATATILGIGLGACGSSGATGTGSSRNSGTSASNTGNSGTGNSGDSGNGNTGTSPPTTVAISEAAYKASAASISYDLLSKDPAALKGKVVTYTAQVFQYDTDTGTGNFIASVTDEGYGVWTDNIWASVNPAVAAHACNNSIIQIWGSVAGAYTYQTQANGSTTIPSINVEYLTVESGAC